jgi:hypothetical protein
MATSDNAVADTDEKISIGKGEAPAWLTLALANRHGLVTGATGTGKAVSLQVMAEGFARAGVPVFAADIKGDLSGISEAGEPKDFIVKRAGDTGLSFQPDRFSTVFWDVLGEHGSGARHRLGNGPAAALPHDGPERCPGGGAEYRVQGGRRAGAAAAGSAAPWCGTRSAACCGDKILFPFCVCCDDVISL